ncbi:uncharacterized protein C8Q71DRAFT_722848 [Rhodofomes roseus]|uniref:Uncharacterized protein n=1 Tax=Rhodofomes roseus TaxID=34475 RepID=A0ABQ8KLD3_9APHY|nr:uncharacterized protein C8Q71DRAFT_722848 [Rhodofomes roseus]KAH9838753.1 hypothetical protein C8Q71DRAFT_722848 [Rhodofomes roseus]
MHSQVEGPGELERPLPVGSGGLGQRLAPHNHRVLRVASTPESRPRPVVARHHTERTLEPPTYETRSLEPRIKTLSTVRKQGTPQLQAVTSTTANTVLHVSSPEGTCDDHGSCRGGLVDSGCGGRGRGRDQTKLQPEVTVGLGRVCRGLPPQARRAQPPAFSTKPLNPVVLGCDNNATYSNSKTLVEDMNRVLRHPLFGSGPVCRRGDALMTVS